MFLRNVSRYCKFEVTFESESDLSESLFLLLVQVNIEDITVPVITDHTRSILSRFPGWTKIYADSIEKTTPDLATPGTVAGKFFNSLIAEPLDDIDAMVSNIELNSYISSADLNEIAWAYVSLPVAAGFVKVYGNGVELSRVSSQSELLQHTENEFVFYYNHLTSELFTVRKYTTLYVDTQSHNQIPIQAFNSFDEFGLKVGLQRLYLESNERFRSRILDVYFNPPDINVEGLKRTLRRELDIWSAYNATPNSNYPGATPEVLEISDLIQDEKYFTSEGNPKKSFFDLVEDLNKRFPSNYGYIKWNEAYWDYAGLKNEGVSRIPQYADATPIATASYQYGIGDFDDAKIILDYISPETQKYTFSLRAHGYKYDSYSEDNYEPIQFAYDSYVSYVEGYYDHQYATIDYEIYLKLNAHGYIPANTVYKAVAQHYVRNTHGPDSSSSPEFIIKDLFTASNLSSNEFVFYSTDASATPYRNNISPSATESYLLTQIPLFAVQEATIKYILSKNSFGNTGSHAWVGFSSGPVASASSDTVVKSFTGATYASAQIKINSNIYDALKYRTVITPKVRSHGEYTIINKPTVSHKKSSIVITPSDILRNFAIPVGVSPQYVHIENIVVGSYELAPGLDVNNFYGGIALNKDLDVNTFVGSSPNIYISYINPNFSTPDQHESYADTVGSTVNYYFTKAKFPYNSTPDYIVFSSNDGEHYPFSYPIWEQFSADSINEYDFYLSENGVVHASPNTNKDLLDSRNVNVINWFDLEREDFGLEAYAESQQLYFTGVEPIHEYDEVEIWTNYNFIDNENIVNTNILNDNVSLNYYDENTKQYRVNGLPVNARYNLDSVNYIYPSLKSGWYYQDEERFIYAKPETEISSDEYEIVLNQTARKGSPIILNVVDSMGSTINYTQVSFYDEATPSLYAYHNYEYLTTKDGYNLYTAYSDILDVTVTDTYTGKVLLSGENFSSNKISFVSYPETKPLIIGREYKVTYRVNNSFNVDNQYFNSTDNSYRSKITLLSTPSSAYDSYVTYESSIYDEDYELKETKLNPLYSLVDEGFLYLSHNQYPYDNFDYILSPKQILADQKDLMVLNVFSKDINNNPKPYISYSISGSNISATPSSFTTDIEGYARSLIRYVGSSVPYEEDSYLYIQDQINATATVEYLVKPDYSLLERISAEVDKKIIVADGIQYVNIIGNTVPNTVVYWRKGRSLPDTFDLAYALDSNEPGSSKNKGHKVADNQGLFNIGPFTAQDDATPGYWFVSVETEFSQITNANPTTVGGDIVYWYEKYDSLQSSLGEPILQPNLNLNTAKAHYADVKAFKVNTLTEEPYYSASATPSWNLPSWYPITKYTQYQMGILGATPYVIEYSDTYPDYEEE